MSAPSVLVIAMDDGLIEQLRADGFTAVAARSASHARVLARAHTPTIVVLGDLEPPHAAGALLVEIREDAPSSAPWEPGVVVIVVSRLATEVDVLRAFELGADDFLAWPYRYLELRARVRARLRCRERGARRHLRSGALEIDRAGRSAWLAGRRLRLSRLEFDLLSELAGAPERVFTRDELLRSVWGFRSPGTTRTLDSHASRLRRKLDGDGRRWVANVRGVGYRLAD